MSIKILEVLIKSGFGVEWGWRWWKWGGGERKDPNFVLKND